MTLIFSTFCFFLSISAKVLSHRKYFVKPYKDLIPKRILQNRKSSKQDPNWERKYQNKFYYLHVIILLDQNTIILGILYLSILEIIWVIQEIFRVEDPIMKLELPKTLSCLSGISLQTMGLLSLPLLFLLRDNLRLW